MAQSNSNGQGFTVETAKWEEPIDFFSDPELAGKPALEAKHMPESVYDFAKDTATRLGVDPCAVALSCLVALSAAVSDNWVIQPKRFDDTWTEQARLWGLLVDKPGGLKTPIIALTTAPLEIVQNAAEKTYGVELAQYLEAHMEWKANKKTNTGEPEPAKPKRKRYIVESATIEALSDVLRTDREAVMIAPMRKVLLRQDEMTELLASMDKYREGGTGASDRGAYMRAYNGGSYMIDRIKRGSFTVFNWSMSTLSAVQPEPFQRIADQAVDDGMLQRFLFYVADQPFTGGTDRRPDAKILTRYNNLFLALTSMLPDQARRFTLVPEAQRVRERVLLTTSFMAAYADASNRLKTALSKWHGGWARMTLLFHMIELVQNGGKEPRDMVVPLRTAEMAYDYMTDILLPHLRRADALMFKTRQTGHATWITGHILSKGLSRIAIRDIIQAYPALRAPEERRTLLEVMESLELMDWVRAQVGKGGRVTSWVVNPLAHTVYAVRAKTELEARTTTKEKLREKFATHRKSSKAI